MRNILITICFLFISHFSFGQGAVLSWAQNYTSPVEKIELDAMTNIYGIADSVVSKRDSSGNLLWTRIITKMHSLAVSPSGDVYITGGFSGNVDFNSWGAGYLMSSSGATDIFVCKLNTNGDFVWAKRIGDIGAESATQISIDTIGHVFVSGKYTGNVDFDPGPGSDFLNGGNAYLLKLDTAGNYSWAKSWNWGQVDDFQISGSDGEGNVVCVTKELLGTFDLNPGIATTNISPNGEYVIFKINSQGVLTWYFKIDKYQPFTLYINLMEVDPLGNFCIAGRIRGTYNFNGLAISNGTNSTNLFVAKFGPNGNGLLSTQYQSTSGISGGIGASGIDMDQQGNIYLTGGFQNHIMVNGFQYKSSLDGNDVSLFCSKISSLGQISWFRVYGHSHSGIINYVYPHGPSSCVISKNGCLYTAGIFIAQNSVAALNFNFLGASPQVLLSPNPANYFIQKVCQTNCANSNFTSANISSMCSYLVNGNFVYNSGTYNLLYINSTGCDSIVNTSINITNYFMYDTIVACDSLSIGSTMYYSSTLITQTIPGDPFSYANCDTTKYTTLTINHSHFDTTYATSCMNYTFNGVTYNTSGLFYQYYVAANLCDSIKVLYLDILQPSSSTLVQSSCGSYTLNGQTYNSSGLYTQTFTNAVGCDSIVYLDLTIYQNPLLSVFPFTDTTVCIGTSYMLYADSNFVSNQWTLNGNIVSYNDSLLVNSSGTYILTCADTNGCYASDTVNIIMMPAPQPIIVQNGFLLTCTNVDSVNYQWFWNNNSIGTNDSTLSLTQNGTYVVFTTDSSGCIGIDTLIVSGVGMDSYTMNEHIQFYPNPTTSLINIESATPLTDATIRIYDMTGALLQEQLNLNGSKFQLNLLSYANGLYQIELINQGVRYRSKVKKE